MTTQGSSAKLVLPAILGEWRAWREIQNLCTYVVCDSKSEKSAPMYCFEGTPLPVFPLVSIECIAIAENIADWKAQSKNRYKKYKIAQISDSVL